MEKLDSDPNIPEHIDITIFPPDNSNNDNTDEDSGEEENVNINNLPGSQLRVEAELKKKQTMKKTWIIPRVVTVIIFPLLLG